VKVSRKELLASARLSMPTKSSELPRSVTSILLVPVILCCTGIPLSGQTQAPAPAQAPQSAPSVEHDPTKAEVQPDLSRERDPVVSPDPVDNAPAGAVAAAPVQKAQNNIYTFRRDVDEVLLNCTVVDEKGKQVMDLDRKNFRVWEDGVPQEVVSFQHQDLPVSMGILVDNSGSMRDKRDAVNAAALDLVRSSNPQDAAFIVNFSDDAYIDQDFTSNISLLEKGLAHVDSRGGTALYDAVYASRMN
jgi:Ca-activated chloride channel family protein